MIDNILFVFEWLKSMQETLFRSKFNLKRVGLIGHSLGGNSLLLWVNRTLDMFQKDGRSALLDRADQSNVKECLILMETTRFSFPLNNRYPLFFLLAEERESYQKATGCYEQMIHAGHQVRYYKGSTHVSFMDHGYASPPNQVNPNESYFNGTVEERKVFLMKCGKTLENFSRNIS